MDLKTPAGRAKARREIQELMRGQLHRALLAHENLNNTDIELAKSRIAKWQAIVSRIKGRAEELGYSEACKTHIATCKGQCCIWHFPQKVHDVHFFVAINGLSKGKTGLLLRLLSDEADSRYQCPMLMENGCFFSFENRPVLCSSAYPCFAKKGYHDYLQQEKKEFDALYGEMESLIKIVCD